MKRKKKKNVFDSADLTQIFQKNIRTILRWTKKKIVNGNKVSGRYYYAADEINALVRKREEGKSSDEKA
ncbi:hypothetical protein ACSBL2_09965 [Pedobacter sp. AW31-3R]|uniref:hypothetical protein n=1 Tax=Pedobacter sp. AW31-3R TaxID=3445781 RepID=UPI003FA03004